MDYCYMIHKDGAKVVKFVLLQNFPTFSSNGFYLSKIQIYKHINQLK